jgi:hypothetical protein
LKAVNFETEGLYEQFLHRRAYQFLKSSQSEMTEQEYKFNVSVWISQGPSGYYRWGGEVWLNSLVYDNNFKQFLFYWLNQCNKIPVTMEEVNRIYHESNKEVMEAFQMLVVENPTSPSSLEGAGDLTKPSQTLPTSPPS